MDITRRERPQKLAKPAKARRAGQRIRTGLTVKLVILALLTAAGWRLYVLQDQLESARQERDAVAAEVEIQRQKNDALAADIAEGATQEKMQEIARRELGWVLPGEYVFPIGS